MSYILPTSQRQCLTNFISCRLGPRKRDDADEKLSSHSVSFSDRSCKQELHPSTWGVPLRTHHEGACSIGRRGYHGGPQPQHRGKRPIAGNRTAREPPGWPGGCWSRVARGSENRQKAFDGSGQERRRYGCQWHGEFPVTRAPDLFKGCDYKV